MVRGFTAFSLQDTVLVHHHRNLSALQAKFGQIPPFPTWMEVMSTPVPAAVKMGGHLHVDKQGGIVNKWTVIWPGHGSYEYFVAHRVGCK